MSQVKKNVITLSQTPEALYRLHQCPLFKHLDDSSLEALLDKVQLAVLNKGEILFDLGDPAEEFFVVQSGQLKLVRVSAGGAEKVLEFVKQGDSFAEAVMFSESNKYPVSAVALIDSQIWCIDSSAYMELLRCSNEACFAVMAALSKRIHSHVAEIDYLTLHSAVVRLAVYLLDQHNLDTKNSTQLYLGFPKAELASRLSIKPATLSRTFSKLSADGLIAIDDSTITLS